MPGPFARYSKALLKREPRSNRIKHAASIHLPGEAIIDDTIQLIRNISHSLMPPTLKNFGLESAVNDLFQKISGSGTLMQAAAFHDYRRKTKAEKRVGRFPIIQDLVNNILKHSNSSFIHLTENVHGDNFYLRIHH
jgi:glucose-6-phosphate-specific signal transduction histidine kinase